MNITFVCCDCFLFVLYIYLLSVFDEIVNFSMVNNFLDRVIAG